MNDNDQSSVRSTPGSHFHRVDIISSVGLLDQYHTDRRSDAVDRGGSKSKHTGGRECEASNVSTGPI